MIVGLLSFGGEGIKLSTFMHSVVVCTANGEARHAGLCVGRPAG